MYQKRLSLFSEKKGSKFACFLLCISILKQRKSCNDLEIFYHAKFSVWKKNIALHGIMCNKQKCKMLPFILYMLKYKTMRTYLLSLLVTKIPVKVSKSTYDSVFSPPPLISWPLHSGRRGWQTPLGHPNRLK